MADPQYAERDPFAPPAFEGPMTGAPDRGHAARGQSAEVLAGSTASGQSTQSDPFAAVASKLDRAATVGALCAGHLASAAATLQRDPDAGARAMGAKLARLGEVTQGAASGLRAAHAYLGPSLDKASTVAQLAELIDTINDANRALARFRAARGDANRLDAAMALAEELGGAFETAGRLASGLPEPLGTYVGGLFAMPGRVAAEFNDVVRSRVERLDAGRGSGAGSACRDEGDNHLVAEGEGAWEACAPSPAFPANRDRGR